jgi:hypothetical protein
MAKERLDDNDRALLGQIPTVAGTALDALTAWFEKGAALGDMERERAKVQKAANEATEVSPKDVVAARNYWIRVVRAILSGLDLAENVDEDNRSLIVQPLQTAVTKALEKSKYKEATTEEAPTAAQ